MNANELKEFMRDKMSISEFIAHSEPRRTIKKKFGLFEEVFNDRVIGDGDYDITQAVFYFKDHNCYIAFEAFYSSHDGTDWSYAEIFDVEPVQVTTTVYNKIMNKLT